QGSSVKTELRAATRYLPPSQAPGGTRLVLPRPGPALRARAPGNRALPPLILACHSSSRARAASRLALLGFAAVAARALYNGGREEREWRRWVAPFGSDLQRLVAACERLIGVSKPKQVPGTSRKASEPRLFRPRCPEKLLEIPDYLA